MTRLNKRGFTIVELMIAITIFTVVLLVCSAAIVHIGRMYYKGALITRTQETSRAAIEDIAQSIQFGDVELGQTIKVAGSPYSVYCLGSVRYTYNVGSSLGVKAGQSPHILWKDRITDKSVGCVPSDFSSGIELVGTDMRLGEFEISDSANELFTVRLFVGFGDTLDLFTGNDPLNGCISSYSGGQFCAVSRNNTTIIKRL